jgi:dCTP deaminase
VILSDTEILAAIERGDILIDPFDITALGGNSYDVRLAPVLRTYETHPPWHLDCVIEHQTRDVTIPDTGYLLVPGILYLGSTVEYTETHKHVPYLDGRSSVGRLGISIHATAGRGDVGFCNHWTMEITVAQPVCIYAGMKIGQLTYHTVLGEVERRYSSKESTTYGKLARNPLPQPSRLWTKMGR